MKLLFEAMRGHELELPFQLAAYYGFRRSEVLGLRWSAIDFEHKLISINHKLMVVKKKVYLTDTLKTDTSNRTLPLIPAIEEALLKQKETIEKNKLYFGNAYDTRYLEYVCVEPNGKIVYPDHMTKKFQEMLADNGLKHIRLHDLRHSCASNMLANGVQMKEIQEWLGHSNFSTTADVYSHLDFSSKVKAANTIAGVYEKREERTISNIKFKEEQDLVKILLEKIQEMGIENMNEYLNNFKTQNPNDKNTKRDIEM